MREEDSPASQGIAIFLALVALIVGAWNLWTPPVSASTTEKPTSASDKRRALQLESRLLSIEKRSLDLADELEAVKTLAASRAQPVAKPGKDWSGELSLLTTRLAKLEEKAKAAKPKPTKQRTASPSEKLALTTLRSRAVNAGLPPGDRLEMLRRLCNHSDPKARSPKVIAAFIKLAQDTDDSIIRREIWTQMKGAKHELLVPALIHSIENDADANVREQAASTLHDYDDRADVRAALEHAKRFDSSSKVRQQAVNSLRRKPRKTAEPAAISR